MDRFNNTDQRISYNPDWKLISNSTFSYTSTLGADLFFLFRGTSLRCYGRSAGGGGSLQFRLDANDTNVALNGTNFNDGPALVWSADNLGDGDHQLWVVVNSLQQNGSVAVDHFEVENSSGRGFDLLWAGPNATNVPKEAIIVDSSSPDIVLSNPSQWITAYGIQHYRGGVWGTSQAGASLNYSFNGVAIWYYSDTDTGHGFYTVSIDGSDPEQLNGRNNKGQLTQQMLWSKTNLAPGRHTFTLRQDDSTGTFLDLDFFRSASSETTEYSVLRAEDASALPDATTPKSNSNTVLLAVAIPLGIIVFAIACVSAVGVRSYTQGRQRKKRIFAKAFSTWTARP